MIMSDDQIIFRYEDVISAHHCKFISDFLIERKKENKSSNINLMPWEERDRISWHKLSTVNYQIANLVANIRLVVTQLVAISYQEIVYPEFTDLVLWREGRQQHEHIDNISFPQRKYTAIAYLTDDYGGGQTFVNTDKGTYISEPKTGSVVMFPADERCPHGVAEVIGGNRVTLAMWFTDDINQAELYYMHPTNGS